MVDTLLVSNDQSIETTFTIPQENPMVNDEGFFTEGGLIENMAQSTAAGSGYFFTSRGEEVPVGYIGAVKHVEIVQLPKVGEQLHTFMETKNRIGNASIVAGKIYSENRLVASCELTIFVNN